MTNALLNPPRGQTEAARSRAPSADATMQALVYVGPGRREWATRPRPRLLQPTDAIVRITTSTICGTDLHILKGDVPTVEAGRILGHEGVGIIEEAGSAVTNFAPGDRVVISCITSCAQCDYCRRGMYSHCRNGGWILGHRIDGTQAEYVRIPYANTSLHPLPSTIEDDAGVMLSDILPTGFECGVLNGAVKPGDLVAIVGAGPIGLAALLTAQFYSPAEIIMIDIDEARLAFARELGATMTIANGDGLAVQRVMQHTGGTGVDVAIEAVGTGRTFDICQDIVAAGGHLANIGVHGKAVSLKVDKLWSHNLTLRTRLVDTVTTPTLLKAVVSGKLRPQVLATHHFRLADAMAAYDAFGNASREGAVKVLLDAPAG